ncbi:hypothetical protein FVEN_g11376 [Fusarium venenatum]|uniref:Uncharacterized protein n=1 Tax=Fusarium venenatum TaxID=56646 RepID=A0A2L2T7E5_9HYPO|nr:uncharacterized protein FVRRES_05507 [Fusarium venenatum]KAG8350434.1 hypothetical protein FVEN_g11376 [Fusarium venenatum]CEI61071.1 unnamed protein product [Fusarium venenatum]
MPRAAHEIIQDLRQQNSAIKRKHAIPEFAKALRRDSFQTTWDAVGAAPGLVSLMNELSIRDLRQLCKRLGMTASARQARPQRRTALGKLVIILFEGNKDGRPLNRFYQDIVPACDLDIIQRFEQPWTLSQQKYLLAGQREHNETKFMEELSSKDLVLAQHISLFRGNIPLTERILTTILTSKRCPPDLIDKLVMPSLKRLLKSRYDDKTRNRYLDLVLQVVRKHQIAEQLSLEKGGLVQYIVDRWCNGPSGESEQLKFCLGQAIELLPSTPKSRANYFERLQQAICISERLSYEGRYELFRLLLLHMKDYQVDIESNSEHDLVRLRQFSRWPSSLFFSVSYRMSLHLFEKLDQLFPQRDFLGVATQGTTVLRQSQGRIKHSPHGDVEVVKALLIRRSKTQDEHPGWLQHVTDLVKERKTKAQQSREAVERAYWAISTVHLCVAAGDLLALKETIVWSRRFIKDSAVSYRLFSSDVFKTQEIEDLLGAMPNGNVESPEAAVAFASSPKKKDMELANQSLIELVTITTMAASEPGFQAENWRWLFNLIRSTIDRRTSKLDVLFNSLSKCTDSDREQCQREMLEIVWKPTIDTFIQIQAALEATHGSLYDTLVPVSCRDSIKGIYLYQRLANTSIPTHLLAELTRFLIDQMRAWLGSRGLQAQMHSVVSAIDHLASSEPQLACPFIRDLILDDDLKEASSWHRQLMSHRFLSVLPARKAEEFLRTMASAMIERMREQNQNFESKEAGTDTPTEKKSGPIKVTTVKMLAQLLQHKIFVDPSSSCEILIGFLSETQHIDIRVAITASLLDTMEEPDCPPNIRKQILSALEEYVVPVASQLNERRGITESDWTAASEGGVDLPIVGEDTPLLDLLIEKAQLSKLEEAARLRITQLIVAALEQSAVANTRYLNLFMTKNNFSLDSLPGIPVHLAPLSKAFIHLMPYIPARLYRMVEVAMFTYIEPSSGIKAISKAIQEDRELVNSNSGKHWLSQFASGSLEPNKHNIRFVLIHAPRLIQQGPEQLDSTLASNGVNRTLLLQLINGCVQRLLKVDRAGEIVSIVRRMSSDRSKSREDWRNWHKNCLPVIEAIILQTKEAQARCQFILSVQALPLPLPDATEEEDNAFIEKLYGVITDLAIRQNYPYHTDLGTLKQEIDYWPLAQCFARLALKLAAVRDYGLESTDEPSLADYLRWEIVAHLLTKATGPQTVAVEVRRLLEEWSRSIDKMINAMGMDLTRTIQHRDWLVTK